MIRTDYKTYSLRQKQLDTIWQDLLVAMEIVLNGYRTHSPTPYWRGGVKMGKIHELSHVHDIIIPVPVIRVKPAKNHSAMMLIESGVGLTTILPQLIAM